METINLATAIDEAYLVPLRVTLASMLERLRPSIRPVLYLLNRNLSKAQLDSIHRLVETHSIVPTAATLKRLPKHSSFPVEAAFPLLLQDLLPVSVERVLFLDPDLLVLDDIAKIWETDLAGNVVGAVADQAIPSASSPRGLNGCRASSIPAHAPYFNAGVMLIDLDKWRRNDIAGKSLRYLESCNADFFHQEALNAVLWDKWMQLNARWNLIASLTGRPYSEQRARAIENPGIVHFAGTFKPWRIRVGGPFASAYYDVLSRIGEKAPEQNAAESLLSIYDRYLRDFLYPTEHLLWKSRLI